VLIKKNSLATVIKTIMPTVYSIVEDTYFKMYKNSNSFQYCIVDPEGSNTLPGIFRRDHHRNAPEQCTHLCANYRRPNVQQSIDL